MVPRLEIMAEHLLFLVPELQRFQLEVALVALPLVASVVYWVELGGRLLAEILI